ncbi:MAG: tetratricopeptide repeat protein [Calditrichaeota bacterium]|nr:tetratricopeptide repeat protein [Calditrichota bacterium]
MKKTWVLLGIISVVFLFFASQSSAQTVQDYIDQGNQAYENFDNLGALKAFQLAVNEDSTNCEALWKLARAHIDVGEDANKDVMRDHYYEGEKVARQAVRICPDDAKAHLELAIAVGRVALMEGGKKKVRLSKEVKQEVLKALKLDPNDDLAHHVLARWNREVANLSGLLKVFAKILYGGLPPASNKEAIKHFKKAIEINPDYINHHLELGITYQEMKKWKLAKEQFEKVATLPIKDSDDKEHKAEAARRLKKVMKKIH